MQEETAKTAAVKQMRMTGGPLGMMIYYTRSRSKRSGMHRGGWWRERRVRRVPEPYVEHGCCMNMIRSTGGFQMIGNLRLPSQKGVLSLSLFLSRLSLSLLPVLFVCLV